MPGLIEGAAQGAGLGIQFLKHLSRTHLLLHLVDIAPVDETVSPAEEARLIVSELQKYSDDLYERERWLVLNKKDLLLDEEFEERRAEILKELGWDGPVFSISAATGEGTRELMQALMAHLKVLREQDLPKDSMVEDDDAPWDPLQG